jgi:uncharacterized iron-regulated protein
MRKQLISCAVLCAAALLACAPVNAGGASVIIDVVMGEPVPWDEFVSDLASAQVIYLGETHSITRHHAVQTKLLESLSAHGTRPALGLEMFAQGQQPVLDSWAKGDKGFNALIDALGAEAWTNLKDYKNLLLTARRLKVPIVALNADDALVRKLARKGPEGLTREERGALPEGYDAVNPDLERLLRLRLRVHKAFQEKSLDRIILAQALRDETMARGVDRFLDSPEGQSRTMLVIAGSGHVSYGFGVPERVTRLKSRPYRVVILSESGELELSEHEMRHAVPVEITHKDLAFIKTRIADYLHVKPLDEPPAAEEDRRAQSLP